MLARIGPVGLDAFPAVDRDRYVAVKRAFQSGIKTTENDGEAMLPRFWWEVPP